MTYLNDVSSPCWLQRDRDTGTCTDNYFYLPCKAARELPEAKNNVIYQDLNLHWTKSASGKLKLVFPQTLYSIFVFINNTRAISEPDSCCNMGSVKPGVIIN